MKSSDELKMRIAKEGKGAGFELTILASGRLGHERKDYPDQEWHGTLRMRQPVMHAAAVNGFRRALG
jgi:hypothetical protein